MLKILGLKNLQQKISKNFQLKKIL